MYVFYQVKSILIVCLWRCQHTDRVYREDTNLYQRVLEGICGSVINIMVKETCL